MITKHSIEITIFVKSITIIEIKKPKNQQFF